MTNNIKICFIFSHLPQGGAERQAINLIKALSSLNYEITLLLYASDYIFYDEVRDLRINLVTNINRTNCKIINTINNLFFIRRFFKKNEYDIVHAFMVHNAFYFRLSNIFRIKPSLVFSIRNNLISWPTLLKIAEYFFLSNCLIITNSKQSAQQYSSRYNKNNSKKILTIYNGIDIYAFNPSKVSTFNNSNKRSDIVIGNVGRQVDQKNQIQILKAIKEINDPQIFVKIIGARGDQTEILNDYVSNNELSSRVNIINGTKTISEVYKSLDIFILSSKYEGCPNVLFEALLSGCLCIISKDANSDNFITNNVNGLVYSGSKEDLINSISHAIELIKSNSHQQILKNGIQYAKKFDISIMVKSHEDAYLSEVKLKH